MNKIVKYPLGLHLCVYKLGFQTGYKVIIMRFYEVVLIFNVLHKEKLQFSLALQGRKVSKVSLPRFLFHRWSVEIQTSISIYNSQYLGAYAKIT